MGLNTPFHKARKGVFAFVLLSSIACLGLSGYVVSSLPDTVASLALAVSILTIIIIPAVLIVEATRQNSQMTYLAVELAWVGVLWVLWLAVGGTHTTIIYCRGLDIEYYYYSTVITCDFNFARPIAALGFLTWIALLGWFVTLLVFGIKGNHWTSPVNDTDLDQPRPAATAGGNVVPVVNQGYPEKAFSPQVAPQAQAGALYNYQPQPFYDPNAQAVVGGVPHSPPPLSVASGQTAVYGYPPSTPTPPIQSPVSTISTNTGPHVQNAPQPLGSVAPGALMV